MADRVLAASSFDNSARESDVRETPVCLFFPPFIFPSPRCLGGERLSKIKKTLYAARLRSHLKGGTCSEVDARRDGERAPFSSCFFVFENPDLSARACSMPRHFAWHAPAPSSLRRWEKKSAPARDDVTRAMSELRAIHSETPSLLLLSPSALILVFFFPAPRGGEDQLFGER